MKAKKRKFNWKRVKQQLSYKLEDIAELLDVHIQTVRNWRRKEGLQTIDDQTPYMVHGSELIRFIKDYNQKLKMFECELHELPCFKCRAPKVPLDNKASLYKKNAKLGFVYGVCPTCSTIMNKSFSLKNISLLEEYLRVLQIGEEGLSRYAHGSLMTHFSMHGLPKRKIARKNHDHHGQHNLFHEV